MYKDQIINNSLIWAQKNKLYLYAAQKDKTITAFIEDWIDSLKLEKKDRIG